MHDDPHEPAGDDYFGVCPECHSNDGHINVGAGHWFKCDTHRVKWFAGSNLFSAWRDQTLEEQRAEYDALDFDTYELITPELPAVPVDDDVSVAGAHPVFYCRGCGWTPEPDNPWQVESSDGARCAAHPPATYTGPVLWDNQSSAWVAAAHRN